VPPRDWKFRIKDILDAVAKIKSYTEGITFESFCTDTKTQDAVLRNITVIGEAARHVPDEVIARYTDIPWSDMRDIRNVVVHEYFGVDLKILWETVQNDIPPLVSALDGILEAEE
jgi:uncharacterized protein with HEPN domain